MNKTKKTVALFLSLVLVFALTVPVFAANAKQAEPYKYDEETGTFTLVSFSELGCTELPTRMFSGAETITREVIIEDEGLVAIGDKAFFNCFRLEKVTIPETVKEISESAFYGCPDNLVIYGEKNSVAEEFAEKNGYGFKEVSNKNKNIEGNISTGIAVTILGMAVVFFILIILCVVLKIFEWCFGPKKATNATKSVAPKAQETQKKDDAANDLELVAVITAAIAASLNTSTYNLNIKSVKRLGSSWSQSAKMQNFNNNF